MEDLGSLDGASEGFLEGSFSGVAIVLSGDGRGKSLLVVVVGEMG